MILTIIINDSPTLLWVTAVDRDALVAIVGGGIEVERPAADPALAMCEVMRRSM